MFLSVLKSKLHRACVTDVQIDYEGSLCIDKALMDRVRIRPYEKILVANLRNGARFETYAIAAPAGSGVICINGAAAHLGAIGDRVIVLSFALMTTEEANQHKPLVLVLDEQNQVVGA